MVDHCASRCILQSNIQNQEPRVNPCKVFSTFVVGASIGVPFYLQEGFCVYFRKNTQAAIVVFAFQALIFSVMEL